MHASNTPQLPDSPGMAFQAGALADVVSGLWNGSLGHTVRCVPTRRTVMTGASGSLLFGKWRRGDRRGAAAEWHWLHVLPLLGLATARPIAWVGRGRRTLMVTAGLPGRSLDAWAVLAREQGWLPQLVDYAAMQVAPAVRRLHDNGLVYRDLYWNHVFADDPRGLGPPSFLDVERVLRPRWRWRRWVIKDLAGLLASLPVALPDRDCLRFLRAYLGTSLRGQRKLVRAIAAKAVRIRRHVPRYG